MSFTVGDHSARHLRRILRTYLAGWGLSELADAAELGLTELVANVVRHVPGRRCALLILRTPEGVRVEVSDNCPVLPEVGDADPLSEDGRGLFLVAALAGAWGVVPREGGKTVWFECRPDAPVPEPAVYERAPVRATTYGRGSASMLSVPRSGTASGGSRSAAETASGREF
ncbi:anti-sigma regulatory factor (Ser/Thr protein kinase) [Streptomyces fulvorobeus]|uniref:Anti-sigma regulatory factor (Ser/Thr protein kinase) n=1 Tax=Streptomyces fulvorobeus TaxID=284028 RepID=A0A7Y9HC15_9ACTN|nr:anti-sigma regulatory factor (Ser/Thr protein kinase) [Streptomyces fulvorobeus]